MPDFNNKEIMNWYMNEQKFQPNDIEVESIFDQDIPKEEKRQMLEKKKLDIFNTIQVNGSNFDVTKNKNN